MNLFQKSQVAKRPGPEIFARASPESLEAIETYSYEQNISRSSFLRSSAAPTGRIEIHVPFDGHRTFPRQARDDIEHQLGTKLSANGRTARIGFLALAGFNRSDLKSVLNLSDRSGAVPLAIPLNGNDIKSLDQFAGDHRACEIDFTYVPESPELIPINIDLSLWDEDSLSSLERELVIESSERGSEDLTVQVRTQENFLRNLLLQMTASLSLPKGFLPDDAKPVITRMSLRWPTITSLRGLHLFVGESKEEFPVHYDPVSQCLEWFQVPLVRSSAEGTVCQSFHSEPIRLLIDYPGEWVSQTHLDGSMEVELPGRLLSGLEMALIDSLGRRTATIKPKLTTKLQLDYRLVLGDSFARRTLSPYQHLYFQEVIPDEMRLADIKNALADRGFKTWSRAIPGRDLQYIFLAERSEAPDPLRLAVVVVGIHQEAERQTQVNDKQTVKSTVSSGDLRIYVRGELRGKSQRLIQEMIAFQNALRYLFPHDPR